MLNYNQSRLLKEAGWEQCNWYKVSTKGGKTAELCNQVPANMFVSALFISGKKLEARLLMNRQLVN